MAETGTRPTPPVAGLAIHPGFLDRGAQEPLLAAVLDVLAEAPLFRPTMPRTGRPLSVSMSNCGRLGWVSDQGGGYRYEARHPATGRLWPPIPAAALAVWAEVAGYPHPPEACLINAYSPGARMGLHRDADEEEFAAPVVSISLGDTAVFRIGGLSRGDPTRSLRLASGDVAVLGGASRLAFHGIDRIDPGTSTLLAGRLPGIARINLTLRRVTKASVGELALPPVA